MQEPGPSPRRDWLIIGGLITVVAVSWIGFFVFWMLRRPDVPPPVLPQAVATETAKAVSPAPLIQPRPLLVQPAPPAAPQSQPSPEVRGRDVALLEALRRSEELKKEGKQREALAELQRAYQQESPVTAQPDDQDPTAALRDLLSQVASSGESADGDALLNAAAQILGGSMGDVIDLIEDLDAEMSGRRRTPRPQVQPQPVSPNADDIVAYVHGKPISRSEIGGGQSPTEVSVRNLRQRILEPLLEAYGKMRGIRAMPGEVAVYQQRVSGKPPIPSAARRQQGRPALPPIDPAAEAEVIRWKVAGVLYERYGGTVIAEQGGRLEPVGAYREFLKEQEANLGFRIEDPAYRDRFWAYYERDFGDRVVPPEKVNFGQAWWLRPAGR